MWIGRKNLFILICKYSGTFVLNIRTGYIVAAYIKLGGETDLKKLWDYTIKFNKGKYANFIP